MGVFRKRSGSSLCYACGKLNRVDAAVCFYCGRRQPGLWGFGPALGWLIGRVSVAKAITLVCGAAYLLALGLDPGAVTRPRGLYNLLAPSPAALDALGMTGAYALAQGRWWTLLTAIYLHGGLLHIAFNMLWVNQLAPAVEEVYGRARLIVIYTAAGVLGSALSSLVGTQFSVGASGAVFGLLGAMVAYARRRGGAYGMAVLRQYGMWALVLFVLGFLMPGVNVDNLAHAGGFAGGYLAAVVLGPEDARPERGVDRLAALATIALTALAFGLALWTAFKGGA
jgi:rhomboid protease GluP